MFAGAVRESRRHSGLRLLDPSRDLLQVADLIEESFAAEMGQSTFAAVQDLRLMAQLGPMLWLLNRTSSEFREAFTGFVWVEDGRVVGNVTLSRAKPASNRWHISNVAVKESHHGRGIGRQLVEAAVELARGRGGDWVVLQVRHDNEPALRIYRALGFESLFCTAELQCESPAAPPAPPENAAGYQLRPCRPGDWEREYELAVAATPLLERWLRDVEPADFRRSWAQRFQEWSGDFFAGGRTWRLCLEHAGQLAGALIVHARVPGEDNRLTFRVHPAHRGAVEEILIGHALGLFKDWPNRRIRVEHSAEHAQGIAALAGHGFAEKRRLLTMRLAL